MDFRNPIQALIPGARGRVLAVLAGTDTELSFSTIGRLASVGVNGVPRVLNELAALGIVTVRRVPPSALAALNRENLAAQEVVRLHELRETALDQLRGLAKLLRPTPRSVVVFGSFARGEASAGSDVDVAVVHDVASFASDEWSASLATFVARASSVLGNVVSIIELSLSEIRGGALKDAFWREVQSSQVVILGAAIESRSYR